MATGARTGKNRSSQIKLNGERGTSLKTAPSKGMFHGESLLTTLLTISSPELGIKSCRSRKCTGTEISRTSLSKWHRKVMGWKKWIDNRHCASPTANSRAVTLVVMSGCPLNHPHNVACLSTWSGKKKSS